MDTLFEQNRLLRERVELLEAENRSLKSSIYDLSVWRGTGRLNALPPLDLDAPAPRALTDEGKAAKKKIDKTGNGGGAQPFFRCRFDLLGHQGSVYCVSFSSERLLASGSFDTSVRLWDVQQHQPQVALLQGHSMAVSSVRFRQDNAFLASTSFDKTICTWDLNNGAMESPVEVHSLNGFGLSAMFIPKTPSQIMVSDSSGSLHWIDLRSGEKVREWTNTGAAPVNALEVAQDGNSVTCGDTRGFVTTYDLRNGQPVHSFQPDGEPISHISASVSSEEGEEGRYLSVNSYGDVVYVYDRGTFFSPGESEDEPPRLLHSLRGHQNRNWPIQSSFFQGKNYTVTGSGTAESDAGVSSSIDVHSSLLLATGSSDTDVYIYDIGGSEGSGEVRQQLSGHRDRVYSVGFHPSEPILATASADFSVKIWFASKTAP